MGSIKGKFHRKAIAEYKSALTWAAYALNLYVTVAPYALAAAVFIYLTFVV